MKNIKIYLLKNKHKLMKFAYSINDHTIPNNICINKINAINATQYLTWQLAASSNIDIKDSGDTAQNIKNFDFNLQYKFDKKLGNIGLLCITGKNKNIIAKFEFYIQVLTQASINEANNIVKKFCYTNHFLKRKTEFQLKLLNAFLDDHKYQAIVIIHNPNNLNNKISDNIYTKNYSKNTKFSNNVISQFILEVMQNEQFIPI